MMRKLVAVSLVVLVGVLAAVPAAQAASPHILKASASINSSGQLVCTFKEAGLGNTLTVADISCSADATAVYQCFNKGGNHPQAGNKETVGGPVSNTGAFPIRNGSASGSSSVASRAIFAPPPVRSGPRRALAASLPTFSMPCSARRWLRRERPRNA